MTAILSTPGVSMPPESHNHRVVEVLKISPQWIAKILGELNLTASGDIEVPEEGRIASNLIIPTNEAGSVMLRFYPEGCQSTKLETGWVDFEIEALDFLSSRGISVPAPLRFKGGHLMGEFPGIKFFAYRLLSGKPLKQSELTKETAQKAGEFLKKMISISSHFFPIHYPVPQGDVEYILKIFGEILERHPSLKVEKTFTRLADVVTHSKALQGLSQTPKGLVHADFFFENFLVDSKTGKCSAIDFGDAYYGHVVMDLVIGSMEFSVLENRSLDITLFEAFLAPHADWLKENNISFDLFFDLLLANCLRFAIYTLPGTLEEGIAVKENPYIFRFYYLNNLKETLSKSYSKICSN